MKMTPPNINLLGDFDWPDVNADDSRRLSNQLEMVRSIMADCKPRTLDAIAAEMQRRGTEATTQSISARLRDLRKKRFGGLRIERARAAPRGLFTYRMLPPPKHQQDLF
jgi:hypothetical protein